MPHQGSAADSWQRWPARQEADADRRARPPNIRTEHVAACLRPQRDPVFPLLPPPRRAPHARALGAPEFNAR